MNIAIIDDDEVFRRVLSRSLTNLNHNCCGYELPQALIEKHFPADLILLDMQLKEEIGLHWIAALRQRYPEAKLILLTAYASIATAVEAIKRGADDYLTKPCTAREILNHLAQTDTTEAIDVPDTVMSVNRLEWEHIQRVLKDHEGNISAAARALGMHRRTLQRKLNKKPARD